MAKLSARGRRRVDPVSSTALAIAERRLFPAANCDNRDVDECKVSDCSLPVKALDWCEPHYQQVRRYGQPQTDVALCSLEGCPRKLYSGELCRHHHVRKRRFGDPYAEIVKAECSRPSCSSKVHCKGLCNRHYAEARRTREPGDPACAIGGCEGPATHRGMCGGHYQQARSNKTITPVRHQRGRGRLAERDEDGNRLCKYCDSWLSTDMFYADGTLDGLSLRCKRCISHYAVKKTYGLDRAEFNALLIAQAGGCAICTEPLKGVVVVDHDHQCCEGDRSCGACVRGLLCRNCNFGLGNFRDNQDVLARAIKYLEEHRG